MRAYRATDWSVVQLMWWAGRKGHMKDGGWVGLMKKKGAWRRERHHETKGGDRGVKTSRDSKSLAGGGVWMCNDKRRGLEMKMKSRFSYWAAALSPSPRPRILTTTPLLLHSGKKKGAREGREFRHCSVWCSRNKSWDMLTFSKPMAQSLSILRVYSGLETGAPA